MEYFCLCKSIRKIRVDMKINFSCRSQTVSYLPPDLWKCHLVPSEDFIHFPLVYRWVWRVPNPAFSSCHVHGKSSWELQLWKSFSKCQLKGCWHKWGIRKVNVEIKAADIFVYLFAYFKYLVEEQLRFIQNIRWWILSPAYFLCDLVISLSPSLSMSSPPENLSKPHPDMAD